MATEDPQYVASLDADINADRDAWTIVNSFNNHGQLSDEQLLAALIKNREAMNPLQSRYANLVHKDGGIDQTASRERRACFKELNRLYSAIDSIKTNLRLRGVDFEFDHWDEEHPNSAYRRYLKKWEEEWAEERRRSSCYIVTALYGRDSAEATRAREVCKWRFALNPLITPSWILYTILGEKLALLVIRNAKVAYYANRYIARPIISASDESLSRAIPWFAVLGIPGWLVISLTVWLLHTRIGG